jgi:hypothetical protein
VKRPPVFPAVFFYAGFFRFGLFLLIFENGAEEQQPDKNKKVGHGRAAAHEQNVLPKVRRG